jgi:cell division protein FtsZ
MTETDGILKFDQPQSNASIIKVLGVGGGGSNAVNHMYSQGIHGVDFIICNTDAQAIESSPVPVKIQLGYSLTAGNGAGSKPEVGKNATIENLDEIRDALSEETRMVFITAGMGGGTGTGGAPVIAKMAKEMGILTIGIVTIPFSFEGRKRHQLAQQGVESLREHVDTLLVINNDKLRELHGNLELSEAFARADNILTDAARGIAEIITHVGYINVDFEDVRTVMTNSGVAIMGTGIASGEHRAMQAVEIALNSPLLNENQIAGASNVLLYITSGTKGIRLDEVTEITDYIQEEAGSSADIIWGNGNDASLGENIAVTIIATGFQTGLDGKESDNRQKRTGVVVGKVDSPASSPIPQKSGYTGADDGFQVITRPAEQDSEQELKSTHPYSLEEEPGTVPASTSGIASGAEQEQHEVQADRTVVTLTETTPAERPVTVPVSQPDNDHNELGLKHQERINRLRELTLKTRSPEGLSELEVNPAYLRRKVSLSAQHHSSDSEVSKYTLNDGEITDNSYLHGGID